MIFESHNQIDTYCQKIFSNKKSENKFLIEHAEDYHLLKAYDRAFWMVYLKLNKQITEAETIIRENENDMQYFSEEEKNDFEQLKNNLKNWKEKSIKFEPLMSNEKDKEKEKKCDCYFQDPNLTKTL